MAGASNDDRPKSFFPIFPSVKAGALYFLCAILWFGSLESLPKALTNDGRRQALLKGLIGFSFIIGSAIAIGLLVHRELARQQRAEMALRDSEERLRAILESAEEGIISIGERGEIEGINPAALKMFGYERQEAIGQNIRMLMPLPEREAHDSHLANYRKTGTARIIGMGREVIGQRKDGTQFPLDLSVTEARLASGRRFVGFLRDITGRKADQMELQESARALADKNKELEAIVYATSHDLRSPLVNIQGFSKELARICDTLKRRAASEGQDAVPIEIVQQAFANDIPRALHFIHAGVVKIDSLLSGLLRYSLVGRLDINIRAIDMNALVDGVVQALKFQMDEAGGAIEIEALPNCLGDPSHLGQVFSNLVDNAIKYRQPNRPLRIKVTGATDGGRAIYGVWDNGIGITPEHRAKVFEIFHRLNPETAQGEGLGLTIAQRILERQNGKIWVEGQAGTGSTFFVSLPAAETQTAQT